MKNIIFSTLCFLSLLASTVTTGQEGKFTLSDFRELHQLVGAWKGMAGNSPFFESFEIKNDTLLLINNYSDAARTRSTGSGNLYFRNGEIFHSSENSTWKVSKKENRSWFFEPVKNASNRFTWILKSPSEWTAIVGNNKYEMKRIK